MEIPSVDETRGLLGDLARHLSEEELAAAALAIAPLVAELPPGEFSAVRDRAHLYARVLYDCHFPPALPSAAAVYPRPARRSRARKDAA
jgi:regulator of sirC expression with transglutaminase-like and TPR domain